MNKSLRTLHKVLQESAEALFADPSPQTLLAYGEAQKVYHHYLTDHEHHTLEDAIHKLLRSTLVTFSEPFHYRIEWGARPVHPYTEEQIIAAYPFVTKAHNYSRVHHEAGEPDITCHFTTLVILNGIRQWNSP